MTIYIYGLSVFCLISLSFSLSSIYYALKLMRSLESLKSALHELGHDFYGE